MCPLPLSSIYVHTSRPHDIREIENLSCCPALEKLFLVENLIRKLKGLDRPVNLKELHLHSNSMVRACRGCRS